MPSGGGVLPSKPLGSYMQFVQMRRATVVAENPGEAGICICRASARLPLPASMLTQPRPTPLTSLQA